MNLYLVQDHTKKVKRYIASLINLDLLSGIQCFLDSDGYNLSLALDDKKYVSVFDTEENMRNELKKILSLVNSDASSDDLPCIDKTELDKERKSIKEMMEKMME